MRKRHLQLVQSSNKPAISQPMLATRIRAGDERAFSELHFRMYPELIVFAEYRLGFRAAAEDVVQDAFVTLWETRARLEDDKPLEGYLYTIVRNRIIDVQRRDKLHKIAGEQISDHDINSQSSGIDEELDVAESLQMVRDAVRELPEDERLAVALRWSHNMTYAELAEATGSSVKAIRLRLDRAYAKLRSALKELVK